MIITLGTYHKCRCTQQLLQQTTSQLGNVVEHLGKDMVVLDTLTVADPRGHIYTSLLNQTIQLLTSQPHNIIRIYLLNNYEN